MANDHARIRRDIWGDDDWRCLSAPAQWLYFHLLTSPALTFAGTTDWRPARISALTADLGPSDVNIFGGELVRARFILPDPNTEEVLIRSWVKHDGLLRSPNISKALVKAHAQVASRILRAVLVDQLHRLHDNGHEGQWDTVRPLLGKPSLTFEEGVELLSADPSDDPSVNPFANPSVKGSGKGSGNRPTLHTPDSILLSPHHGSPSVDQVGADDERKPASKRKAG